MEAPLIPGTFWRFQTLDPNHDQEVIRREVQEGGPHLYVFGLPFMAGGTRLKALVEAYHPWEMRPAYIEQMLDPMRMADLQDGRLIAINTIPVRGTTALPLGVGRVHAFVRLTPQMVTEIRRNNRNARGHLRRTHSKVDWKLEHARVKEEEEAPIFEDFADAYEDAFRESKEHALGKPRISLHGV